MMISIIDHSLKNSRNDRITKHVGIMSKIVAIFFQGSFLPPLFHQICRINAGNIHPGGDGLDIFNQPTAGLNDGSSTSHGINMGHKHNAIATKQLNDFHHILFDSMLIHLLDIDIA